MRDLRDVVDVHALDLDELERGLCKSAKSQSIYYGDDMFKALNEHGRPFSDPDENRWWARIRHGGYSPGYTVNLTRQIGSFSYATIDSSDDWELHPNATYFPKFLAWLTSSDMFESFGRVVFFIQNHGLSTPAHADYSPGDAWVAHRTEPFEFIWCCPRRNKRFYVIEDDQKVYAPTTCWFDNSLRHGADATKHVSWSFRVDGRFSTTTRRMLGL